MKRSTRRKVYNCFKIICKIFGYVLLFLGVGLYVYIDSGNKILPAIIVVGGALLGVVLTSIWGW